MVGDNPQAQLVVLAGPSAVGKSTVVNRLRSDVENLYFSVSMTTREPRPGEVHGRDYYYVSSEEFQDTIDRGEMLEWAEIHGGLQRSGTPGEPVKVALAEGRPVLVEVDLEGARNVARMLPEARTVFLAPPNWETLVERLTGRGTEPVEVIERRLETARAELAAKEEFDHVVVNETVDDAVSAISDILQGK